MESPKRAPADPAKRATALAAVLGWLLSLAASRGVTIDPDVVLQLNTAKRILYKSSIDSSVN